MSPRVLIRRIGGDLGRLWVPLLSTDVLTKLLVLAIVTPATALALRLFLMLAGQGEVVADEEILGFALSPVGLATLLSVGALVLAAVFLEHATLIVVGLMGVERETVRARDALWSAARRFPGLVRLGLAMLIRTLPVLLPLAAVLGGLFLWLLADYDINYYLSVRPREWRLALGLGGAAGLVAAMALLYLCAGWFLAIPILILRGVSPRDALAHSGALVARRRRQVVGWVVLWILATAGAGFGATAIIALGTRLAALSGSLGLGAVAAVLVLLLLLTFLVNALVSFFSAGALSLLVVALFRDWAEAPEEEIGSWMARESVAVPGSGGLGSFRHGRAVLLAGGVALALIAVVGAREAAARLRVESEPLVIAHRGSSAEAPENTMAAIELALDQGADWVEIDVQETADGRIVVAHDRDLRRVGGASVRIGQATWSEIEPVDVGSAFDPRFAGERVPLLEEVLEAARDRAGVVIELKYYGHEQEFERRVVDIVERVGAEDRVRLMSLKLEGVRALKALRPDWNVGLLTAVAVGDLLRLEGIDFHAVNAQLATAPFLRRAHSHGTEVFVWTVNDPINVAVLSGKGVDGIITDVPEVAARAIADHRELSALERFVFLLAYRLELVEVEEPSSEEDA
jgi:glycerophosphoryl diester phosphodiesterase